MSRDIGAPGVDERADRPSQEQETALSLAERELLREAMARLGEARAAATLRIARATQARALAGLPLRRSVTTCIRTRLPALRERVVREW
jgi:hypothetical protein